MNALATKPPRKTARRAATGTSEVDYARGGGQASDAAEPASASSPLSATPADAVTRINEEVSSAMKLIGAASKAVVDDDSARMLYLVNTYCLPPLLKITPAFHTEDAVHAALNHWYDADAVLVNLSARYETEPAGALIREAVAILAPLQPEMDRLDFWPAAATVEARPPNAIKQVQPPSEFDPLCVMQQALEVVRAAVGAADASTDMYWGVFSLVEKGLEHVDRAQAALEADTFSKDLHDSASNELAGLLGVLNAVNTDALGDMLLAATATLVTAAKAQVDADNEARLNP